MDRPRSLWPLVVVLLGALGLLGLGLYGLQGRIEGGRLRERERIRLGVQVEAGLLRERVLRPSFWEGREDVLRYRLSKGGELMLEPEPAPPRLGAAFGADAGDPLLLSWMRAQTEESRAVLLQKVKGRKDALGTWLQVRILLASGDRESGDRGLGDRGSRKRDRAKALVQPFWKGTPMSGWEGPFLRLFLDLGDRPPPWALDWLAGRPRDEILALDPEQAGVLRQQALLRARARSARYEIPELGLDQRELPLALPLRQGQEILFAFEDPAGGVQGLLASTSLVRDLLGASLFSGDKTKEPLSSLVPSAVRDDGEQEQADGEGVALLPGLQLHPRYPEEDLGYSLQALYALAGAILVLGIVLATRALAKERRAFAQREDFLRAATHELKTPLTSLRLLLESLVSGRIVGEEKRAEYLRLLQGETERLSGLVGQALDFRRVEQGTLDVDNRTLDLEEFLGEMVSLYAPQLEKEGRALELEVADGALAMADPALLRRILWNLCENARLHGAGTVTLCVECDGATQLSLDVQDEGEGLAPKDWDRVFLPFARGPGAGEGRVPGIGLGLAFVRRLARAMGGDCRIQACEQGFRIRVTLQRPEGQA